MHLTYTIQEINILQESAIESTPTPTSLPWLSWKQICSFLDFNKCREEIAVALNEFCKRWCRREHVECNALNSWKIPFFNIIEKRISFYSKNLNLLPPKPKLSFRHLKQGIQQFHEKFVLAPADKASNNAIVV